VITVRFEYQVAWLVLNKVESNKYDFVQADWGHIL
jgi:hypothetical protein